MRTHFVLIVASLSALLWGCSDNQPIGASKSRCSNLNRNDLEGAVVADSCFQLESDAFSFANFTGGSNLTAKEMVEVFGSGVCRTDEVSACDDGRKAIGLCNNACVLTDKAAKHMHKYNDLLKNGHCDGMAAMSQLIQMKTLPLFANQSTFSLEKDTPGLPQEIARWWTTQITVQQRGPGVYEDVEVSDVVEYLDHLWVNRSSATLWLYYINGGHLAAHAVTPYAITSMPNDSSVLRMYVYDNNKPEAKSFVELSPTRNEWTYDLGSDPTSNIRAGSNDSPARFQKLRFVPNEARVGRYCWFCENTFANQTQNLLTLSRDIPGRLAYSSDKTKALAERTENGEWSVSDGINLQFPLAGTLDDHPLPSVLFEPTEPYQIEFTGGTADQQVAFLVSAPGGVTLGVDGIQVTPNEVGLLLGTATIDPQADKRRLKYEGVGNNATLHWSAKRTDADYEFRVTIHGPGGSSVALHDDEATNDMHIEVETAVPNFADYQLKLEISRSKGGMVQTNEFVRVLDAQKVTYEVFPHAINDTVDVTTDIGSDGTIDVPATTWMPTTLDPSLGTYVLTTEFLGRNACLEGNDPVSPEHNGNAFMNGYIVATGQQWQFVPIAGGSRYHLKTVFLGTSMCLDANSDPNGPHGGSAFMNNCDVNAAGQRWTVTKDALGTYLLQTPELDPTLCLEGNEPSSPYHNGSAFLDNCQSVSGQAWILTALP